MSNEQDPALPKDALVHRGVVDALEVILADSGLKVMDVQVRWADRPATIGQSTAPRAQITGLRMTTEYIPPAKGT